ncbi:MAG: hypothetical protein LT105_13165 [Lentimicrobium sp.]|nr:hypothetical protein [Lentimicrobium sp.]
MKTLTPEQQLLFDSETAGLQHAYINVSQEFITSLGFDMVRYHEIANLRGDEAELEVYEDKQGRKIIMLIVTQVTASEGDLLHISCYASPELMPLIEEEARKYR